jgi:hypothetical protein
MLRRAAALVAIALLVVLAIAFVWRVWRHAASVPERVRDATVVRLQEWENLRQISRKPLI